MPNRIIKESICTSEDYAKLSLFERDLFIRLIVSADDYGRYDGRAAVIRGKLFPLETVTDKTISDGLMKLSSAGIVVPYEVDGKPYLRLTAWERHQQIRAKRSKFPAENGSLISSDINCNQMISNDCNCTRNPIRIQSESEAVGRARDGSFLTDEEADALRAQGRAVDEAITAAVAAGFPNHAADWDRCAELVGEYGLEPVLAAIRVCVDRDTGKRTWGYLRGILKSDPTGGARERPDDTSLPPMIGVD